MSKGLYVVLIVAYVFHTSHGVVRDEQCTSIGGTCKDWRYTTCAAGYETGLCSGDANNRCCLPCDAACNVNEQSYNDAACEAEEGECKDDSNYCTVIYVAGKCGGPANRKCCTANSGSCDLVSYSTTYVQGLEEPIVRVHTGFVGALDTLTAYARECGVTVYVTHAFRKDGQNIDGAVVPPATTSNHLVGHAIDFNLATPMGWCNSACMTKGRNTYSECFLQRVKDNRGLRWGGTWSTPDPVHIDDGLNVYDKSQWDVLYYQLQRNC